MARRTQVVPFQAAAPIKEVEDFENRVTLRLYIEKVLNQRWGRYLELVSGGASFISCAIYIGSTYFDEVAWLTIID